jgi:hypothetical protein
MRVRSFATVMASALLFVAASVASSSADVVHAGTSSASGWAVLSSPKGLLSASCASANSCMAVGSNLAGSGYFVPVADTWDGSTWTDAAPAHRGQESALMSVSCTSSSNCMAVGYYVAVYDQSFDRTMAETWNGSTWSILPTPNKTTSGDNVLDSVSCTSANNCVAVGRYSPANGNTLALAEGWNGSAWTIVAAPTRSNQSNLTGVSCTGPTSCVAVGYYLPNGSTSYRTLIESWNGSLWSVVASPNLPTASWTQVLYGVSCTSSTQCAAVGGAYNTTNPQQFISSRSLIETWNGAKWSMASNPSPDTYSQLQGVSCVNMNNCVAVGFYSNGADANTAATLIETWNGSAWSTTPNPGGVNRLYGVTCASPSMCLAVGTTAETGPA